MDVKQKNPKTYDVWLLWDVSDKCNLNCAYCNSASPIKKNDKIPNIDILSLIRVLKKPQNF